jgi:signal transduction histidine kinase/FixJ family two-component response regulator
MNRAPEALKERRIRAGVVEILYRRLPTALAMSAGISLLFVVLLAQSLPFPSLLAWITALYLVTAARAITWRAYRGRPRSPEESEYWVRWFRAGAAAAALTWSIGTTFLLGGADPQQTLMLVITILAVSAVAVATLGADFPSLLAFSSLTLGPVAIALLLHEERLVQVAGLAVTTSMLTIFGAGRRISADIQKLLSTELDMSALVMAESQARASAEAANDDLRLEVEARQRAEAEALAKDARLRVALESARTYAWEYHFDPPRMVVTGGPGIVSPAAPGDGTASTQFLDEVHPDDVAALREAVARARRGEGFRAEFRLRVGPDWRWLSAHGRLTADGGVPRLIGVTQDVTRRRAEQQELLEAKDRAEAGSRAKSEFLATMSHEIRTPLNGIVGMLELLGDTELTDAQRSMASGASRSCEVLMTVINDVLDLSRIEANRLDLESISFDPRTIADDVTAMLADSARRKGLTLSCQMDWDAPPRIIGDPQRLRQVLINLVSNAVKFTSRGEVVLTITGRSDGASATRLRLTISDTGIGISDEEIGRLFQPFSQADMSTSRKYGGSGLGLAISHRLIELMGGSISVASTPGAGSTFTVDFTAPESTTNTPTIITAHPTGVPAPPPMARPNDPSDVKPGRRVLLVEDHPLNQQVARAMLGKLGCEVTVASSGVEGVSLAGSGAFDLILMDCQMPEVDGLEATRRIRAREGSGTRTPIVALTANALNGDRERCLEAGMDDYLTKPLTSTPLRAMLERWSTARPKAAEGPRSAAPEGAVLDEEALGELAMLNDGGILAHVIGLFYNDGQRLVLEVRRAWEAGSVEELAFAAHTLKSSSGAVGARRVRTLCSSLEREARGEQRLPHPDAVAALENAFEAACMALAARTGVPRPAEAARSTG